MMATGSTFVSQDEGDFIRFLLTLKSRPSEVKAGLQRLCALYEAGMRLQEDQAHRLLVRGLLPDATTIVRRWAYKAIAWLGTPEDVDTLVSRLRDEHDFENQTWAMAAIIALADERDVSSICAQADISNSVPLLLAARLFAEERWLRQYPDTPIINVDQAEPLTLKWAALLSGYGRAPPNLFHPRHENKELLGKLNAYPEPEVSEYSVWALWQNPKFAVSDMTIRIEDVQKHPKNVRRWINRLITKTDAYIAKDVELIDELRSDPELAAREGLALGLRKVYVPDLGRHVLDWHSAETEEIVRDLLLEHMASYADADADYAVLVEESFKKAGTESGIRKRLLAASVHKRLHAVLKGHAARQRAAEEGILQPQLIFVEKMNMTTFNAGRDIIAQNLVGGDMINSANAAVQRIDASRDAERKTLTELLQFLEQADGIAIDDKKQLITAIQSAADSNSKGATQDLLTTIQRIASTAGLVTGVATKLHDFAHVIASWF